MTSNKSVCEDHVSGLNQKPPESPLLGSQLDPYAMQQKQVLGSHHDSGGTQWPESWGHLHQGLCHVILKYK